MALRFAGIWGSLCVIIEYYCGSAGLRAGNAVQIDSAHRVRQMHALETWPTLHFLIILSHMFDCRINDGERASASGWDCSFSNLAILSRDSAPFSFSPLGSSVTSRVRQSENQLQLSVCCHKSLGRLLNAKRCRTIRCCRLRAECLVTCWACQGEVCCICIALLARRNVKRFHQVRWSFGGCSGGLNDHSVSSLQSNSCSIRRIPAAPLYYYYIVSYTFTFARHKLRMNHNG